MNSLTPRYKALIVEDNPNWLELFHTIIQQNQKNIFVFIHTDNLAKTIEILQNEKIDIVLLDLVLPDSNPLNTLQAVSDFTKSTPFIVITTLDDEKLMQEAIKYGIEDYLVKDQYDINVFLHATKLAIQRTIVRNQNSIQEKTDEMLARLISIETELDKLEKANEKNTK
jgi:DNA-binding NarL/FixJ family response regulator